MPGTRRKFQNSDPYQYDRNLFDYVCRKVPLHQNIGYGSTSKLVRREPKDPNNWRLQLKMLKEPLPIWDVKREDKWCSCCGEVRHNSLFSPDKNRYDGLDVWCKPCRAADQKRRYWLSKDSEEMWQQWEIRHIKRAA